MTLQLTPREEFPVFDKPPVKSGKREFFARRFFSLAGRPILAEKNLPVTPASSHASRKCYVTRVASLFKGLEKSPKERLQKSFIPQHSESRADFETHPGIDMFKRSLKLNRVTEKITSGAQCIREKISAITVFPCFPDPLFIYSEISSKNAIFSQNIPGMQLLQTEEKCLKAVLSGTEADLKPPPLQKNYTAPHCSPAVLPKFSYSQAGTITYEKNSRPADLSLNQLGNSFSSLKIRFESGKASESNDNYRFQTSKKPGIQPIQHRLVHDSAQFDLDREPLKNLIIEHKCLLKPDPGNKFRQKQQKLPVSISYQTVGRPPRFRFPLPLLPRFEANPGTFCIPKLQTNNATDCLKPVIDWKRIKRQPDFGFFSLQFPIEKSCKNSIKNRFRLKLKLNRSSFIQPELKNETLSQKRSEKIILPVPTKIPAGFRPLKKAASKSLFRTGPVPTSLPGFKTKKSPFLVMTAKHARYTRRLLRKPEIPLAKTRLESSAISKNLWKLRFQTRSKDVRSISCRDRIRLTRIQSIRMRPTSFLMYLNAPSFTDIVLPVSRRRLKSPAGQFYLHGCGQAPVKRKNSLRTLRFKLTPITSPFFSSRNQPVRKIHGEHPLFKLVFITHTRSAQRSKTSISQNICQNPARFYLTLELPPTIISLRHSDSDSF
jgi:hypothetical protein